MLKRLLLCLFVVTALSLLLLSVYFHYGQYLRVGECLSGPVEQPGGTVELDVTRCSAEREFWMYAANYRDHRGAFFPEPAAVYWNAPIPNIAAGNHLEIRGSMPNARFFSFQSYTPTGGFVDVVPDYELVPRQDSINWIRDGVSYPGAEYVQYVLKIVQVESASDIPQKEDGVLYVVNNSSEDHMILMRVYANYPPNDIDTPSGLDYFDWVTLRGQVELPTIVYVSQAGHALQFDDSRDFYLARAAYYDFFEQAMIDFSDMATARLQSHAGESINEIYLRAKNPVEWRMNASVASMLREHLEDPLSLRARIHMALLPSSTAFSNDANNYFVGALDARHGEVMVTRVKYMTSPRPDGGVIDASVQDIRFWSFCAHAGALMYTTKCIEGNDMQVDDDGYVTFVVSSTGEAPIDPATGRPAANWMPYPALDPLILIRHLLPSRSNRHSLYWYGELCKAQGNCEQAAGDIDAIKTFTQELYPRSRYCSVPEYERDRCGLL